MLVALVVERVYSEESCCVRDSAARLLHLTLPYVVFVIYQIFL